MALTTTTKAKFDSVGIKLSAEQETKAAELEAKGAIDWSKVIDTIGSIAKIVVPILISLLGGSTPTPSPTPATKAKTGVTCDPSHHCNCKETFCKAACNTHESICLSEQLACALSCTDCDPCVMEAFHHSICHVFHSACVMASASHCLCECCCCD